MSIDSSVYIHPSAIVDEGCTIGANTKVWHFCHLMPQAVIGEKCSIGQNVFIANNVVIGSNIKVQNNVSLYEGVICEDDVFLGPSMVFTNVYNPRSAVNRRAEYRKTHVKKGVTIGANATIVCGTILNEYSFIAAGAVINRDVPSYALMAGVPAKRIGWMSRFGSRIIFDETGKGTCRESSEQYELKDGKVTFIG